jgi:hypothetical protein
MMKPIGQVIGSVPERCDICETPFGKGRGKTDVAIDGATIHGSWAWMCPTCFASYGIGIGLGKGQKYRSMYNAKICRSQWVKTAG